MEGLRYRIGRFTLIPFRQLLDGDGPVAIGRKALELLSVLAKADGALVTKDELMSAVWPRSTVEENAIHVHVAALRKVLGADADLLNTVHGLGYRLAAQAAEPRIGPIEVRDPADAAPIPIARRWRSSRWRFALAGVFVAGLAVIGWVGLGAPGWPNPPDGIAVAPLDVAPGDTLTRDVAGGVAEAVAGALGKVDMKSLPTGEGGALTGLQRDAAAVRVGAAFALGGRVQRNGETLHVGVTIDDPRRHQILWSADIIRSAAEAQALQEQVAARVANVLQCTFDARSYGGRVPRVGLSLYLYACDSIAIDADDRVRDRFRQVVGRIPGFANGWANLAMASALASREQSDAGVASAEAREARAAAERALQLDPRNGLAYGALATLQPPGRRWERYQLLRRGLAVSPDSTLLNHRLSMLLAEVGRSDEGIALDSRAFALHPFFYPMTTNFAFDLAANGRVSVARTFMERAARTWPGNDWVQGVQIQIEARFGDSARALALLDDPRARPDDWEAPMVEDFRRFSLARQSRDPAKAAAYAAGVVARLRAGQLQALAGWYPADMAMEDLIGVGANEAAFALARSAPTDTIDTESLFRANAEGMRRDPRFMPLAAKLGLVDFWRRTGRWPDFCQAPNRPYDCRAVAARLGKGT